MKTYIIIGASSGIGLQLAKTLADKGDTVIGTYNSHPLENSENITYHPLNVTAAELDLSFFPEVIDGIIYCPASRSLM